ncbi:MAG: MauE/DoxX family redox-associated membrane protein [Vicinamibacterales bacterium]
MAASPQARGLRALSVLLGVFFLFQGLGKLDWLADPSPLRNQLAGFLEAANRWNRAYLELVCIPYASLFARLVPLGEMATGAALVTGAYARYAAIAALLMVLNFHVAGGFIFQYAYLTNGYGFPVVGGLLALASGGVNLPFGLTRK